MSLMIEPGEMIGLVGTTGAGKSTLVNLVCRFYDVSEGAIVVDGVDVRSFRVADYRQNIGIVLQDPFLFYGTIAENISYGRPQSTREEIIAAARAARAGGDLHLDPDARRDAAAGRLVLVAVVISLVALVLSEWLARRAGMRFHGE